MLKLYSHQRTTALHFNRLVMSQQTHQTNQSAGIMRFEFPTYLDSRIKQTVIRLRNQEEQRRAVFQKHWLEAAFLSIVPLNAMNNLANSPFVLLERIKIEADLFGGNEHFVSSDDEVNLKSSSRFVHDKSNQTNSLEKGLSLKNEFSSENNCKGSIFNLSDSACCKEENVVVSLVTQVKKEEDVRPCELVRPFHASQAIKEEFSEEEIHETGSNNDTETIHDEDDQWDINASIVTNNHTDLVTSSHEKLLDVRVKLTDLFSDDMRKLGKEHTNMGPCSCLYCKASYTNSKYPAIQHYQASSSSLNSSRKTSRDDSAKLIQCRKCLARFPRRGDLKMHLVSQSSCGEPHGSGKKPDSVPQKIPLESQSIAPHLKKKLTTPKNLQCMMCHVTFTKLNSLRAHEKRHAAPKTYECDKCHAKFNQFGNMARHITTVHSDQRPFTCDECGKTFKEGYSLKIHQRNHTGDLFNCKFCNKKYETQALLNGHSRTHTNIRPYQCEYCPASFKQGSHLKNHARRHTEERPFECDFCGAKFKQAATLYQHKSRHNYEKPFKCKLCPLAFGRSDSLASHMKIHSSERPFQCKLCNVSFRHKSGLTSHNEIHHQTRRSFQCELCPYVTKIVFSLKQHMKTHSAERKYECAHCLGKFKNKISLRTHLLDHTNVRPFKCEKCDKKFKQKSQLTVHLSIHNTEKLYKCHLCPSSFKLKYTLRSHIKRHLAPKRYECDNCKKKLATKQALSKHLAVHTGERNFKCEYCSATFKFMSSLRVHIRLHTGERPYKCKQCSESFTQSNNLKLHTLKHTKERPYECAHCRLTFQTKNSLKFHVNVHSGKTKFKCSKCSSTFRNKIALAHHSKHHYKGGLLTASPAT